jgi:2-polyprenyl-3-methyl-5-hydroxy-6-metoxy-1,4-benzoquinol methylase
MPCETTLPVPHRCPWPVQYWLLNPLRRLVEPPARLLGPHVQPGMTVLEPGCGMGYFSLPLARMVGPEGRVLCVDVEPRAVERLIRRARRAGLADRVTARPCGPRDLGLAEQRGQVDLALVLHVLHEAEDLTGFVDQIHALLRPQGRMLVVESSGHVAAKPFEAMLARCEDRGLRVVDRPRVRGRRAALLARRCGPSGPSASD